MNLIELRGVDYSYPLDGGRVPVLRDVNLTIAEGEMVAIQGPSGSGKSTFLYILGCLLQPDKGQVRVAGYELTQLSQAEKASLRHQMIGFVFQQFHLLPRTSALENILLPTEYPVEQSALHRPAMRERAVQLATELGLGERLEHSPNQLSGGQQQRVAIARALMNNARLILADEPTGNLDSTTSKQILELLRELNRQGKTVVLITHDPEIGAQCDRVIRLRDGRIVEGSESAKLSTHASLPPLQLTTMQPSYGQQIGMAWRLAPLAFQNLKRNRLRSVLTMVGIVIGVAAVLAMITLGQFTKHKILDSYAELGVNTLEFSGYPNWQLRATDQVPVNFQAFQWDRDLKPLARIFPQIQLISPQLIGYVQSVSYGGRSVDLDVTLNGVNEQWLWIAERALSSGQNISPFHVRDKSGVCLLGSDIATRLFPDGQALQKIVTVSNQNNTFACRVMGVLAPRSSNNQYSKPNTQIYLPYTYLIAVGDTQMWSGTEIRHVLLRVRDGADVVAMSRGIEAFFDRKYGKSGRFHVSSDSVLLAQMNRFLTLFTVMLGTIALISLGVGGIGITNMMLVSVTERLKEIGLRKAVGATDESIRLQFLMESILLCSAAGVGGLFLGFFAYEGVIYGASRFVTKLQFEWTMDLGAALVSLIAILTVGVLSGLAPALKAERLQVIEALRTD